MKDGADPLKCLNFPCSRYFLPSNSQSLAIKTEENKNRTWLCPLLLETPALLHLIPMTELSDILQLQLSKTCQTHNAGH